MILFISPKYGTRADSVALIKAAQKKHIRTNTLLNNWDRVSTLMQVQGANETFKSPVAVYGEHAFCEFLAQELHLNLHSNSLDWIAKMHSSFLKRKVRFMSLDDLISFESETRSVLSAKFLEPADDMCFRPGIYTEKLPRVPRDTKILVHDDCEWQVKYRFLIVEGKIESSCCYKIGNTFNDPKIYQTAFSGRQITAEAFTRTVIEHNKTAPACILDVGFGADQGWGIVGTYPVWSSELYGLNPTRFVEALFIACEQMD